MTARGGNFSAHAALLCVIITTTHGATPSNGVLALAPDVTLGADDREGLAAGQPIVRLKTGRDGYVALTALVRVDVTPERFLRWMTSVEALQKGKYVPEIGRFSMPPVDTDVAGLTLELDDLEELERCEPGDCGLKLSAPEIAMLAGPHNVDARRQQMRRVIVQRASDFLQRGDEASPPYVDHREPVDPASAFAAVLQRVEFLPKVLPCLDVYLRAFPAARESHLRQSLLYWSKESLGLKPIISITHVSAARFEQPHLPEAVVVARQVYASHYKNASITVTALVPDGSVRYVVYLNRTHVDAFGGVFGRMVRRLVERRVKAEAPDVLLNLRRRMEAGEPPA